jgi:hypothetical protein
MPACHISNLGCRIDGKVKNFTVDPSLEILTGSVRSVLAGS